VRLWTPIRKQPMVCQMFCVFPKVLYGLKRGRQVSSCIDVYYKVTSEWAVTLAEPNLIGVFLIFRCSDPFCFERIKEILYVLLNLLLVRFEHKVICVWDD